MNLSFSENIGGVPSFFVQQILSGLYAMSLGYYGGNGSLKLMHEVNECMKKYEYLLLDNGREEEICESARPKIHTFREDKGNLWKVGTKINFIINGCGQKNRYQFAPILECCCVQKAEIRWFEITTKDGKKDRVIDIVIDKSTWGRSLLSKVNEHGFISELAKNDGFSDAESFCEYFKKGFSGKLIHWVMPEGYKLPEGSQMWKNHTADKLFGGLQDAHKQSAD